MKALEKMCLKYPKSAKGYKNNKEHIDKFFYRESLKLFTSSLPENVSGKVIDRLITKGQYVLYVVIIMVCEELRKVNLSSLHYERAKILISEKCANLDKLKLFYRLMNCGSDDKSFRGWISKHAIKGCLQDPDYFNSKIKT